MDKYIIGWSNKYGYCSWYDDKTEQDYWNYQPLEIFAKLSQARNYYYKNINNCKWKL